MHQHAKKIDVMGQNWLKYWDEFVYIILRKYIFIISNYIFTITILLLHEIQNWRKFLFSMHFKDMFCFRKFLEKNNLLYFSNSKKLIFKLKKIIWNLNMDERKMSLFIKWKNNGLTRSIQVRDFFQV